MKIIVLGTGALGSVIGAHLVRAGEEVIFIARGPRAAFLQQHGLRLTGLADFTAPITVTTRPQEVQEADFLMVTVKTYDMEPVLASVQPLTVGSVLSWQNGVLKQEQLARTFGWERVLGAAAIVSGEVLPEGTVRFTLNERLALGELPAGTSERAEALATTLVRAGLMRLATAQFLNDPDGSVLVARIVRELGHIAARLGIPLEDRGLLPIQTLCSGPLAEAVAYVRQGGAVMAARAPAHKNSLLHDLERGRRLEVEETPGYCVRKGVELDIPLPTVDTCYRLLAGVNRHLQSKAQEPREGRV
jgi:2-dehydropantoate 2-reductase